MIGWILKILGMRAVKHAVGRRVAPAGGRPPMLDFGLGFSLFRDRRVPAASKLLALLGGGMLVSALVSMELPVELLMAGLLNVLGIGFDLAVDGLEMIVGPVVLGALLLTHLAPKGIVDLIRAERYGIPVQQAPGQRLTLRR